MRVGSIITSVVGIALAAGAVFFVQENSTLPGGAAVAGDEPQYTEIVVARASIRFGQEVGSHLVGLKRWPIDAVPDGAIFNLDEAVPQDGDEQRRARMNIVEGEVVLTSKLSGFGEKVTITQKLGENTRAMAIKVNAETAVGGFVTPGDSVDIVLTTGRGPELQAVTILQNIRVIGVDQQSEEQVDAPEIARTITGEVSPNQGQQLALAQKAGTLSLTLRTLEGVSDEPMELVSIRDLLRQKSPVEETDRAPVIKVRRAGSVSLVDVK